MTNNKPNDPASAAWFGQLRAHLAKMGMSQERIKNAIGSNPSGRTRSEIANDLSLYLSNQ